MVVGGRRPVVKVGKDADGVRTVKGYVFRVGLRCGFLCYSIKYLHFSGVS